MPCTCFLLKCHTLCWYAPATFNFDIKENRIQRSIATDSSKSKGIIDSLDKSKMIFYCSNSVQRYLFTPSSCNSLDLLVQVATLLVKLSFKLTPSSWIGWLSSVLLELYLFEYRKKIHFIKRKIHRGRFITSSRKNRLKFYEK